MHYYINQLLQSFCSSRAFCIASIHLIVRLEIPLGCSDEFNDLLGKESKGQTSLQFGNSCVSTLDCACKLQ